MSESGNSDLCLGAPVLGADARKHAGLGDVDAIHERRGMQVPDPQTAHRILHNTLCLDTEHACQAAERVASCSQLQLQLLVAALRVLHRLCALTFKV
jgi:hypothetical protein